MAAVKEAKAPVGTPTLAASIAEARNIAPELSAVTDELNRALMRVERALVGMKLNVPGGVELKSMTSADGYGEHRHYTKLAFVKQGANWGLFIEEGTEDRDGESPVKFEALLTASKTLRVHAADALPALVKTLIDEARRQRLEIAKRVQAVEELATLLTGKTPDENPVVLPTQDDGDEIPF
jgi:hypothetical protein